MTDVELKTEYSTPNPDEATVVAARGDYMKKSLIGDESVETALNGIRKADPGDPKRERMRKFIEQMLQRGHFGPFEHPRAFFAVEGITRDQMAQITRHRVGVSFDVQSMRYVDFSDAEAEVPETASDVTLDIEVEEESAEYPVENIYRESYESSLDFYRDLREAGMEPEDARKVLPIGTKVNMTFTASLRALMHIFDLRVSGAAQHDTRGFTQQVMDLTEDWAPISMSEYKEHVKGQSLNAP